MIYLTDYSSEVEAFLRHYHDLPLPSRQSMYLLISFKHKGKTDFYSWHGIFQQLTRQGCCEIAERLTFQCDIFGKLPLEVAYLISENLPMIDIRYPPLKDMFKWYLSALADTYAYGFTIMEFHLVFALAVSCGVACNFWGTYHDPCEHE